MQVFTGFTVHLGTDIKKMYAQSPLPFLDNMIVENCSSKFYLKKYKYPMKISEDILYLEYLFHYLKMAKNSFLK